MKARLYRRRGVRRSQDRCREHGRRPGQGGRQRSWRCCWTAWEPYGGEPKVGEFFVLDTDAAIQHADELDSLIDGQEDELGEVLAPVRDFLRQVAGKN